MVVKTKEKEKSSTIGLINIANSRVAAQQNLLSDFHRMKEELETANEKLEKNVKQQIQRQKDILAKTVEKEKKCTLKKKNIFSFLQFINF